MHDTFNPFRSDANILTRMNPPDSGTCAVYKTFLTTDAESPVDLPPSVEGGPPAALLLDADAVLLQVQAELAALRRENERHKANVRRLDDELHQAARLQRDLQPPVPHSEHVDIHIISRPADRISGDVHEVVRLDESHLAIFAADATGHDMASGMLALYIRRTLWAATEDRRGRALPDPGETLARMNRDLVGLELRDCHFVTAVYAVYDERTRVMRWARAGAPYPIMVSPSKAAQAIPSDGPLLGAIANASFEVVECSLEPGDAMLFHTDGLDGAVVDPDHHAAGADLSETAWFAALGTQPLKVRLQALEDVLASTHPLAAHADDITMVAVLVREETCMDDVGQLAAPKSKLAAISCS